MDLIPPINLTDAIFGGVHLAEFAYSEEWANGENKKKKTHSTSFNKATVMHDALDGKFGIKWGGGGILIISPLWSCWAAL